MIIGVPRERKTLEQRVAITPYGAQALIGAGHEVLIEKGAGRGSYFSDDDYKELGAKIVPTLAEVWNNSELIVKVKEPHESEFEFFRAGLTIFDYLHLAGLPDVAHAMIEGKVNGIAYELVEDKKGGLPLLEPMSEVAGKLSVINGASCLLAQNGGRGTLLGGTSEVRPAKVVIVGAGISGKCACEMAVGLGARVTILDLDESKLNKLKKLYKDRIVTCVSSPETIANEIQEANLVVSAVLIPGAHAPTIINRDMVKNMKEGAVIVDISIDQGGSVETIKPTSLEQPTYIEEGVIHYAVTNMPAQTPRTSTKALTVRTLPYIQALADGGIHETLKQRADIRKALNTFNGFLTNKLVSDSVNIDYTPIENALS